MYVLLPWNSLPLCSYMDLPYYSLTIPIATAIPLSYTTFSRRPKYWNGTATEKLYKRFRGIECHLDDETRGLLNARIDDFIQELSKDKDKDTTYTIAEAFHDILHAFTFDYYCKHSHTFPDEKEQEEINAHISSRQEEISSAVQSLSRYSQLFRP